MTGNTDLTHHGLRSSGARPGDSVAAHFSQLARDLQAAPDVDQTLQTIVDSAVMNVDGADLAGITLVTGAGKVSTPAASDELVRRIDRIQYETGQGPCLSSVREQATVRSDDLRREQRWPMFAARAAKLGVLSMMAFQLYVKERDLGALNLYSRTAGAFSTDGEDIGLLFSTHAAIALIGAQHEASLQQAMVNCDAIGQAKGILMERHKITAEGAFLLLTRVSQHRNQSLQELARIVATTGQEPGLSGAGAPVPH